MAAMRVEAECRHILAREQDEIRAELGALGADALHVRRRILDRDDVRVRLV